MHGKGPLKSFMYQKCLPFDLTGQSHWERAGGVSGDRTTDLVSNGVSDT